MKNNIWRSNEMKETLLTCLKQVNEIIVYDTETTGLSAEKNRIIQLSAIKAKVNPDTLLLEEVDRFDTKINPEQEVSKLITNLTGITQEEVDQAPTYSEIFPKVFDFFGSELNIAAYNSKFDIKFLTKMYERTLTPLKINIDIDVLKLARDLVEKETSSSHKLQDIAKLYGADIGLTFHNSMDDVIATMRLLNFFIQEYQGKEVPKEKVQLEKVDVLSIASWKSTFGKKGGPLRRVYVNTEAGSLFYDINKHRWSGKDIDISVLDMDDVRKQVFILAEVTNEDALAKFEGKKTA